MEYTIEIEKILHGRSRNECWFEPGAAVVPPGRNGARRGVIVTASQLTGNDMGPHHYLWSHDSGRSSSNPAESQALQVNHVGNDVYEKPWLASPYNRMQYIGDLLPARVCF